MATTSSTNYTFTDLTPLTDYEIDVKAKDTSGNLSSIASITYKTPDVDSTPPELTVPDSGTFNGTKTIAFTTNEPSTIYYTQDGSIPTRASSVYTDPIVLTDSKAVKAFAVDWQGNESDVKVGTYTRNFEPDEKYLDLDGVTSGIVTASSITTTAIEMDVMFYDRAPTDSGTIVEQNYQWVRRQSPNDNISNGYYSVFVDGNPTTNATPFLPANKKVTVRLVNTNPMTAKVYIGVSWNNGSRLKARLYGLRFFNGGALIGKYDFTKGNANDLSGSNTVLSLYGTPTYRFPDSPKLTAPTEVQDIHVSSTMTSNTIAWSEPVDADYSHVRLLRNGVELFDDLTGNLFVDKGLKPNTSYTYRLISTDNYGNESLGTKLVLSTLPDTSIVPEVSSVAQTHTHDSVKLTWTNPFDPYTSVKIYRNGTAIASDLMGTEYTDNGLSLGTTYNYKIVVVGVTGKESAGTSISATTDATPTVMALYMYGNSYRNWIETPSVTYNRLVLDFKLPDQTIIPPNGTFILLNTGQETFGNKVFYSPTGTETVNHTVAPGGLIVNGVPASTGTNFITPNTRTVFDMTLGSTVTEVIRVFGTHSASPSPEGYVYSLKAYNGDNLILHYDMGKGTLNDQSGNNKNGKIVGVGGKWLKSSDPYVDTTPPPDVANLEAASVTGTGCVLKWTEIFKATDFARYDIYKNDVLLGNVTGLSYTVSGLTADNLYKFTVKAVDTKGNFSVGESVQVLTSTAMSTVIPPVADSILFDLNLIKNKGSWNRTVYDRVSNVKVDLPNAFGTDKFNNIDFGFINDKGYTIYEQGRATINTGGTALASGINMSSGITLEFLMAAQPVRAMLITSTQFELKSDPNGFTLKYTYLDFSGVQKTYSAGTSNTAKFTNLDTLGTPTNPYTDTLRPKGELNLVTVRLNTNGTVDVIGNTYKYRVAAPADFSSYVNCFNQASMTFGGFGFIDNTQIMTMGKIVIHNRLLTDGEVLQNYAFYNELYPFEDITITPSSVNLDVGSQRQLVVYTVPYYYDNKATKTFDSGNAGFVTVSSTGLLAGVLPGETDIGVHVAYGGKEVVRNVPVEIVSPVSDPDAIGSTSRTITGISINKKTDSIEVGEAYVVMATTLPYDIFYDNVVIWESSNPDVCEVHYGVLEGKSVGTATITAYDSTKTFSESFTIEVKQPVPLVITEAETYYVNGTDYGLQLNNTDSLNTTNGIQAAWDFAHANGYKKIVYPNGTYLVNPTVRSLDLPSDMVIDFSDSVMNIEPSAKTATGYVMINMKNIKNTMVTRLHLYGEADSTTLKASWEGCLNTEIKNTINCGYYKCTISKSPGFNIAFGNSPVEPGTETVVLSKNNLFPGNINNHGLEDDSITSWHFRTKFFLDISSLGAYYMLGYNQGYSGYPFLRSRLYSIYFYDANKQFMTAHLYNLQFYEYVKPVGAKYAKIVIYQEAAPTGADPDFQSVALLRTIGTNRKSYIRECRIENNFSTGIAACGGYDNRIEGNFFSGNNGRMPGCDIDYEDGWENACGDIVRNNTFGSNLGITTASSSSLAVFDNLFNNSRITVWDRTCTWRIFRNTFNGRSNMQPSFGTQGDSYLAENVFINQVFSTSKNHATANYSVHVINNTVM